MSWNEEKAGLLVNVGPQDPEQADRADKVFLNRSLTRSPSVIQAESKRTLGWVGGVFAAVSLAQFSTNIFQRVGRY